MARTKKTKAQRIPVDNLKNEPKWELRSLLLIKEERLYLILNIFSNDITLELDIKDIELCLSLFKDKFGEGINKAILMLPVCPIIYNNIPVVDSSLTCNYSEDTIKSNAGINIEDNVINYGLIPILNGTLHPNGAMKFPDWSYNSRYVDIKSVLVERSKMKYQAKYNNPVYSNAIEDSEQVLNNLLAKFKYNNATDKQEKFCHSLLVYCYYEIHDNFIRLLDFVVVPTIQAILVTEYDNKLYLSEKNKGKNTNTRISLTYNTKTQYRTTLLFNLINLQN